VVIRFQIKEVQTVAPDYDLCGQAIAVMDYTNLGLVLNLDGEEIINETDLTNFTFGSPITTIRGYIISNVSFVNTDIITITVDNILIDDLLLFDIEITKTGYLPYVNSIYLHGYDIGNNPNIVNGIGETINYNLPFDFILVAEANNVVNGEETKSLASFIKIPKPFSTCTYLYKNNSTSGTTNYHSSLNDIILSTANGFYNGETLTIFQKNTISFQDNTSVCSSANNVLYKYKWFLNWSTNVINIESPDCIVVGTEFQVSVNGDINDLHTLYVDDAKQYPFTDIKIIYSIYDINGLLVQEQIVNITDISYLQAFPTVDTEVSFILEDSSSYMLITTLQVGDVYGCCQSVQINTCNYFEYKKLSCGVIELKNNTFNDLVLEVSQLVDSELILIEEFDLTFASTLEYTFPDDGVYLLLDKSKHNLNLREIIIPPVVDPRPINPGLSKDEGIIVVITCALEKCYIDYIENVICTPCSKNSDSFDIKYNFNVLTGIYYTIMTILAKENFASLIVNVTDVELVKLHSLNTLIQKAKDYCLNCNPNLTDNDCGCN